MFSDKKKYRIRPSKIIIKFQINLTKKNVMGKNIRKE